MKYATLLFVILLAVAAFGQNPPTNVPAGQLSFTALNGPFGSAGADIFGTYAVTTYGELREDNYLFPAANGTAFFGSYQYALDRFVCPLLVNTNVNCGKFSTYVNAGAGVTRTTIGDNAVNHVGGGVGAGINFDPAGNGRYTINLVDFHYNHFNFETVKGWTPTVALGITLGFGTNQTATVAKQERFREQQAKRLAKAQARAKKFDEQLKAQ